MADCHLQMLFKRNSLWSTCHWHFAPSYSSNIGTTPTNLYFGCAGRNTKTICCAAGGVVPTWPVGIPTNIAFREQDRCELTKYLCSCSCKSLACCIPMNVCRVAIFVIGNATMEGCFNRSGKPPIFQGKGFCWGNLPYGQITVNQSG